MTALLKIGYLLPAERSSEEDTAVLAWLQKEAPDLQAVPVGPSRLAETLDVLWVHFPTEATYEAFRPNTPLCASLRSFVEQGGRLLLTDFAAYLPHDLGFEPRRPETRLRTIEDEGFGRGYGFQSYRGHPLLDVFHGGLTLWQADEDHTEARVGYFDAAWPAQGRVVGVEKGYIRLHPANKLLVEHAAGAGRVVSVGAFVHFAPKNHRASPMRHFIRHALHYLTRPEQPARASYWIEDVCVPREVVVAPSRPVNATQDEAAFREQSGLSLPREEATDAFIDVAGRRCLMMGKERGGLDEVWVHPFRLLRDLEIGLITPESVQWLRDIPTQIRVRPEAVTRTYRLGLGTLTETLAAALDRPGGLIRLHAESTGPLRLLLRFRVDFRWMWPYPDDALGSLHFGYDEGLHALHVHDRSGDFYALYGADQPPDAHLSGAFDQIDYTDGQLAGMPTAQHQLYQAFLYDLDPTTRPTLHIALAGTNQGRDEAEQTFRTLLTEPSVIYDEVARHYRDLLESSTRVATPDPEFDEAYRWAVVGADRFRADTPGLGMGLMAGYGTAAMGWDGGHPTSGRPGYAWYFGRDAAWAGLAVGSYGDVDTVRRQLLLFRDFQDVSGKIFHELTTSGVVHYDAADATPLYVILAAHYARASGDRDTLRALWPSLRRAMDFLFATDTDGDGLIENTNVGHGWIEGGPLFGAHTSLYLAGLWAQSLHDAAYLADLVGEDKAANRYARAAWSVMETIHRDFWNEETQFFHHSKRRDGTFEPEPTVLPAVPMLFALLHSPKTSTMLDTFASNAFSTDWGVRLLPARSPLFDPESYHGGTVWPLFTGWTALAEYAYGRSTQGFSHVMNTLQLFRHHTLGFADEVLHGTRFAPMRVCPHQCWSETGALHPILAGLVGFHPDAPDRRLHLEPRPPLHWATFRVDNLWMGDSRIHMAMQREPSRTTYRLTLAEGPAVEVTFAPEIPYSMQIGQLLVNGTTQPLSGRGQWGLLERAPTFTLEGETIIDLRHTGGLGAIPHVPCPEPGDASMGFRLIREAMHGAAYTLTVEGPTDTTSRFQIKLFDRPLARIDGAEHVETSDDSVVTVRVVFEEGDKAFSRKNIRFFLE